MERDRKHKLIKHVFNFLMQETTRKDFALSRGGKTDLIINNCLDMLEKKYGNIGPKKIIDYCICQVYVANKYEHTLKYGTVFHFFGDKAVGRFVNSPQGIAYYEDKWLKEHSLSRANLVKRFGDEIENPLHRFVFPEYEERTKKRVLNQEAGFIICLSSTLLWTPFSATCLSCRWQERCKQAARDMYPKLYSLRIVEYQKAVGK